MDKRGIFVAIVFGIILFSLGLASATEVCPPEQQLTINGECINPQLSLDHIGGALVDTTPAIPGILCWRCENGVPKAIGSANDLDSQGNPISPYYYSGDHIELRNGGACPAGDKRYIFTGKLDRDIIGYDETKGFSASSKAESFASSTPPKISCGMAQIINNQRFNDRNGNGLLDGQDAYSSSGSVTSEIETYVDGIRTKFPAGARIVYNSGTLLISNPSPTEMGVGYDQNNFILKPNSFISLYKGEQVPLEEQQLSQEVRNALGMKTSWSLMRSIRAVIDFFANLRLRRQQSESAGNLPN